jgi:hypothetical protein
MNRIYLCVEKVQNGFVLEKRDSKYALVSRFVVHGDKDVLCYFVRKFMSDIGEDIEQITFDLPEKETAEETAEETTEETI